MAGRADLGRVQGIDGVGVVAGGTTGQALVKSSNTDYDTEWASVTVTVNNKSPDLNGNTAVDGTDINVDDDEATPQTIKNKFDAVDEDISGIGDDISGIGDRLDGVDTSLSTIGNNITGLGDRLDLIDAGLDGGTVNQVLVKKSATNKDSEWRTLDGGNIYVDSSAVVQQTIADKLSSIDGNISDVAGDVADLASDLADIATDADIDALFSDDEDKGE